jgi:hypothetical protein
MLVEAFTQHRAESLLNFKEYRFMATMTCKSKTPSTFGKKNKTASRSYIAVQNFMEGDEFVMRGEPNIFVEKIVRNEKAGSVKVVFCNGMIRKYTWSARALIIDTPTRNSYRRNSLRRNGYQNYLNVLEYQSYR